MERRIIILLSTLCVISLLIGFWVGRISERKAWQGKFNQVVKSELDWLKSQIEITSFMAEEPYRASGTVIDLGDKYLTIEQESGKQTIKVNVSEETEIFRASDVSSKIILEFDDIKAGDYLFLVSKESVADREEITAKKIQISNSDLGNK